MFDSCLLQVIAHNKYHEGEKSDVKTIEYDKDLDVTPIFNLVAEDTTNRSVTLKWDYNKKVDHFRISVAAERPYPVLPTYIAYDKKFTIPDLAPGVLYTFTVSTPFSSCRTAPDHQTFQLSAVLKSLTGPEAYVSASTLGVSLLEVGTPETMVVKDLGTSVKLSWSPSKDIMKRSVQWVYGVYYGLTEDELLEKSRLNTTECTATVSKLLACENYMFGIGIVGPYGIGPVSHVPAYVKTYGNRKAAPKQLNVVPDSKDDLVITVHWEPACATSRDALDYVVSWSFCRQFSALQ